MTEIFRCVTRGLVVGDPDQAIFQFAGANRDIFAEVETLSGEAPIILSESHRCSRRVAAVATALSRSKKVVLPRADAPEGRTVIVVHREKVPGLGPILEALSEQLRADENTDLAAVSRKGASKEDGPNAGPWTGGSPRRFCLAVSRLRLGNSRHAAQLLSRELGHLLLDDETPSADRLREAGIEPRGWNRAMGHLLMSIERRIDGETWNSWMLRVKAAVEKLAGDLGLTADGLGSRLKRTNAGGEALRTAPIVSASTNSTPVETIHSVKGREFSAVVVLASKPHATHAPCPSESWWADDGSEEREVAYVACSRAKTMLCLAVHEDTYRDLVAKRPEFAKLFEVVSMPPAPQESQRWNRAEGGRAARRRPRPG